MWSRSMLTRVQLATHSRLLAQGSARRRRVLAFGDIASRCVAPARPNPLRSSSAYLDGGLSAQVLGARFPKSGLASGVAEDAGFEPAGRAPCSLSKSAFGRSSTFRPTARRRLQAWN